MHHARHELGCISANPTYGATHRAHWNDDPFSGHASSARNKSNQFTGWTDVDLAETGEAEAVAAGKLLKELGYDFDVAYTSVLKRAIRTLW